MFEYFNILIFEYYSNVGFELYYKSIRQFTSLIFITKIMQISPLTMQFNRLDRLPIAISHLSRGIRDGCSDGHDDVNKQRDRPSET